MKYNVWGVLVCVISTTAMTLIVFGILQHNKLVWQKNILSCTRFCCLLDWLEEPEVANIGYLVLMIYMYRIQNFTFWQVYISWAFGNESMHNNKTLTFLLIKIESLVLENTRYDVSDQAFLLCDHWRNILWNSKQLWYNW